MNELIDIFLKGGPVMWPILALSLIAVAILAWRAISLALGDASDKGLVVVSTIITAEPMLGILGTVTGIIKTFGALQGADGAVNPISATAGIGEALITTAAGLVASLVILFPYNVIAARIDAKADEKE